jgi:hypothetical protein
MDGEFAGTLNLHFRDQADPVRFRVSLAPGVPGGDAVLISGRIAEGAQTMGGCSASPTAPKPVPASQRVFGDPERRPESQW